MSKTLDQIFIANPITTNASTDLMYFSQSPYTSGKDAAMTYANFAAQFALAGSGVTSTQVQVDAFNLGTAGGTANAQTCTLSPAPTIANGLRVSYLPINNSSTTSVTLDVNGNGAVSVLLQNGRTVQPGDINTSVVARFEYSVPLTAWILLNPVVSFTSYLSTLYDTGSANAYTIALSFLIGIQDQQMLCFNPLHTNTGASTFEVNSYGLNPIVKAGGTALVAGDIVLHVNAVIVWNADLSYWELLNPQTVSATGVTAAQVQSASFNSAADSGTANAYVAAYSPVISSYTEGLILTINNLSSTNSAASTFDAGAGAQPIMLPFSGALTGGEMHSNNDYQLQWSVSNAAWILLNPFTAATSTQVQQGAYNQATDTGAVNAYVGAFSPAITTLFNGLIVTLIAIANANTDASTINVNGTSTPIVNLQGGALIGGEILLNGIYNFQFNGITGNFVLLNSSLPEPVSGASPLIVTPSTGDTVTLAITNRLTILNPASTLATLTVEMPASPIDGQLQTVSTTQIVSALTVSGNGNSIIGEPTALTVGQSFTMIYNLGDTTWYPA